MCYTPYGEAIVDEHLTTYENPFKFSGKELDDITGLYDHGARSRNPVSTQWYEIDPLFEKYPDFSTYNYCAGNPVKLVDPDGKQSNPADFFDGCYFDILGCVKNEMQGIVNGLRNWYDKEVHGNSTLKTCLLLTAEFLFSYGPEKRSFENESFSEALKNESNRDDEN